MCSVWITTRNKISSKSSWFISYRQVNQFSSIVCWKPTLHEETEVSRCNLNRSLELHNMCFVTAERWGATAVSCPRSGHCSVCRSSALWLTHSRFTLFVQIPLNICVSHLVTWWQMFSLRAQEVTNQTLKPGSFTFMVGMMERQLHLSVFGRSCSQSHSVNWAAVIWPGRCLSAPRHWPHPSGERLHSNSCNNISYHLISVNIAADDFFLKQHGCTICKKYFALWFWKYRADDVMFGNMICWPGRLCSNTTQMLLTMHNQVVTHFAFIKNVIWILHLAKVEFW